MVHATGIQSDSDDLRRPRFRRGWSPQVSGYSPFRYPALTLARADRAWRQLVQADSVVRKAPAIADAMGASREIAARCRRAFDALGLIDNIPGSYNLEAIDDWQSNIPAIIRRQTRDPEALLRAVGYEEDCMFFVCSKHAPGLLLEDWRAPSSLRSSGWESLSRPSTVWMAREGTTDGLPKFLAERNGSLPVEQGFSLSRYSTRPEPFGDWTICGPPPMVVLARDDRDRLGAKRRAPTSHLLTCQGTGGIGPKDVMAEFGCSLATAKRTLDEWIDAGLCRRVARGKYAIIGRIK